MRSVVNGAVYGSLKAGRRKDEIRPGGEREKKKKKKKFRPTYTPHVFASNRNLDARVCRRTTVTNAPRTSQTSTRRYGVVHATRRKRFGAYTRVFRHYDRLRARSKVASFVDLSGTRATSARLEKITFTRIRAWHDCSPTSACRHSAVLWCFKKWGGGETSTVCDHTISGIDEYPRGLPETHVSWGFQISNTWSAPRYTLHPFKQQFWFFKFFF